jgi:hypothetical protein
LSLRELRSLAAPLKTAAKLIPISPQHLPRGEIQEKMLPQQKSSVTAYFCGKTPKIRSPQARFTPV